MPTVSPSDLPPLDFVRLAPPPGSRIAVLGGCGGLGQALVRAAADIGLHVAVLDLQRSLDRHPPPVEALAIPVDATDAAAVDGAFDAVAEAFGGLDTLVTLVGVTAVPPRRIEAFSPEEWDALLAVNLRSAFLACRAALPLLRKGDNPSIVTVSSLHAALPPEGFGPYGAAKAALVNLTKGLALENAPAIRANSVAPSGMLTPFIGGGTGRGGEEGPIDWLDIAAIERATPLGRMARPEDVVGPILFLAGPAGRYITGQLLHVSGGRIMP